MRIMHFLLILPLLLINSQLIAADLDLPLPPTMEKERALEPDVKIIKGNDKTLYEYRLRGELYLVKVVPAVGKPYYMVDSDGNGSLDSQTSELDPRLLVPTWILFRW